MIVFISVFIIALAFDIRENDPTAEVAIITLRGTTVRYVGKINDMNVERLFNVVKGKTVTELIVSSSGGEINAGMRMGEWVFDNQLDVVVEGVCMSSCANYIFTAGKKKTIKENSIVAWHGNILQESGMFDDDIKAATIEAYEELPEQTKAQIDLNALIEQSIQQMHEYRASSEAKQSQFFRKIGVDEYVCRVGNVEYQAKDFFCLSVEDMARFGIHNVIAPDNYDQIDLSDFQKEDHTIEFIHLQ